MNHTALVAYLLICPCVLWLELEWNDEMIVIWYSIPFCRMQSQRHFTFRYLAGLFNLEPSQLLGEYSTTRLRTNCRCLALLCHHWLLLSTHSHLCRVGVVGVLRVHSFTSHYCPGDVREGQIQRSAYWCSPALDAHLRQNRGHSSKS